MRGYVYIVSCQGCPELVRVGAISDEGKVVQGLGEPRLFPTPELTVPRAQHVNLRNCNTPNPGEEDLDQPSRVRDRRGHKPCSDQSRVARGSFARFRPGGNPGANAWFI